MTLWTDLEHGDDGGGVEQEGGPGGGAGHETPAHLYPAAGQHGQVAQGRAGPHAACAGVLLREHELPEVLPEDHHHALQE